jgi:hypothetical protein
MRLIFLLVGFNRLIRIDQVMLRAGSDGESS